MPLRSFPANTCLDNDVIFVLKGALVGKITKITDNMSVAAACSMAKTAEDRGMKQGYIKKPPASMFENVVKKIINHLSLR